MPELKELVGDEIHAAVRVHFPAELPKPSINALESQLKTSIDEKMAVLEDRMRGLIQKNKEISANCLENVWRRDFSAILTRELDPFHRQISTLEGVVQGFAGDLTGVLRRQKDIDAQLKQLQQTLEEEAKKERTRDSILNAAASLPARYYSSADCIRLEVVEPALEHVRRLLVAHEKMLNTIVEQRCVKVEHNIENHLTVWEQNLVGFRTRLNSFQRDVRGALTELCQNLNVACPGF
ncbi:unnamed protein product [Phytomonas sp. Hart1]|nr:unnamed protein product [Phytomonas sp. Hart1]|eukprot:CCW69718.1 unnamed protein product [Phytomonas sp. isolate Hart1]